MVGALESFWVDGPSELLGWVLLRSLVLLASSLLWPAGTSLPMFLGGK